MTRNRAALALSMTALAVAVLGQTAVGHAAANVVRVALFAQNSARVDNLSASRTPVPGRLLALDAKGRFPASVLPSGAGYTRTIVVHPDADVAKAGSELFRVLAAITDNSASNPYLVKIEPGIYDLANRSLVLKPYVDVEGSGELVTTITSGVTSGAGTVVGADRSELRFITVKNNGVGQQSVALFAESTSPRFTHVTATSTGGSENYAIHLSNGSPVLTDVTATASGGASSFGLANFNAGTTVASSSFSAADSTVNAGVLTTFGGSMRIVSTTMTASGGAIAMGMRAYNGNHSLANVTISASGATQSYGLYVGQKTSAPAVTVNHSRVSGGTNSVYVLGGSAKFGASQLSGPAGTQDSGTVACAASYDAAFAARGPGC